MRTFSKVLLYLQAVGSMIGSLVAIVVGIRAAADPSAPFGLALGSLSYAVIAVLLGVASWGGARALDKLARLSIP